MQHNIGIGVPGEPARMRNADASEHHVIAVAEGVHVEAVAGANIAESGHAQCLGANKIVVGRKLHVAGLAGENGDGWPAHSASAASSVKSSAAGRRRALMRRDDEIKAESLRGLHQPAVGCDQAFR